MDSAHETCQIARVFSSASLPNRIFRIRWQDRIMNEEVLQRAQTTSLETMLIVSVEMRVVHGRFSAPRMCLVR